MAVELNTLTDSVKTAARVYDTVTALVSSTDSVSEGDTLRAGPYLYTVAASGATDNDMTRGDGTKLYVVPDENGQYAFDAFDCEKITKATYVAGVPGYTPTTKNKTILGTLIAKGVSVKFGYGVYPFDDDVVIAGTFRIAGVDRDNTLIWCPNSNFLRFNSTAGATDPYIKDICIEADGSVIKTFSHITNALHAVQLSNGQFVSYSDHTFFNDSTTAGGTGCPIYGCKIKDCAVYAGAGKGVWAFWKSGSNIFDNVVDIVSYFDGSQPSGVMLAMFYNSNVRLYCNSNICYNGMDYLYRADESGLYYCFLENNVIESNSNSFQAVVKTTDVSNFYIGTRANLYINNTAKENGYSYYLTGGNIYVQETDSPQPIFCNSTVRNAGFNVVRAVTTNIDTGGTKFRLQYHEPFSYDVAQSPTAASTLLTPNTERAYDIGMQSIYAASSANISYIQIFHSIRSIRFGKFVDTTANRPSNPIVGEQWFDTTIGKPIWYDGANWIDAAGTTV